MKTLTIVFLLFLVISYTGCHFKKEQKTKDIEISVIDIGTNQYPDEELDQIPIFVSYRFEVKNNKDTSILIDNEETLFPTDKRPESFFYGIYNKDTLVFFGYPVQVKPKSKDIFYGKFNLDDVQKLYDDRDQEKFPDIQSFLRDLTSNIVIYYVGKSDTCLVKHDVDVKIEFLGSDTTAYEW
ncbi:hypothetical protein [uncultured Sanguibacteroides sp.]|uniref:hypothetical protein n=1 Tax=uncultured Sanguibacteroides sp. TaxID=1635151 RepID=UPI0025FFD349|nr:hypothetical protein [uncultured Sanguibacteroides sp.]